MSRDRPPSHPQSSEPIKIRRPPTPSSEIHGSHSITPASGISETPLSFSVSQFSQDPTAYQLLNQRDSAFAPVSRPISTRTHGSSIVPTLPTEGSPQPPRILHLASDPSLNLDSGGNDSTSHSNEVNNPFSSPLARDALLSYAYNVYDNSANYSVGLTRISSEDVHSSQLLPLLRMLRVMHPSHAPTMLLLGCVHFRMEDFQGSLDINLEILSHYPNYVEAMCNAGTSLRALGNNVQAFEWWWKALQMRPNYFDVLDIMIDTILSSVGGLESVPMDQQPPQSIQIYKQAIDLCRFVLNRLSHGGRDYEGTVATEQVHRVQKIFYTSAILHHKIAPNNMVEELVEYSKAIELAIGPFSKQAPIERYSFHDLILATYVSGLLLCSSRQSPFPVDVAAALSNEGTPFLTQVKQPGFNLMRVVKGSTKGLLQAIEISLPAVLLSRDQTLRLPMILWPSFTGILPGVIRFDSTGFHLPEEKARQSVHHMTSKIILATAKRLQDSMVHSPLPVPGFGTTLRVSLPLVLILNYLALSLSPSPGAYNNLGILLSVITATRTAFDVHGAEQLVTGQALARSYYEGGLFLDPRNPHLLTNMGSLMKDLGRTQEAIQYYTKAIYFKPDFPIALANLANAIKDMGRPWDAIPLYRRAITSAPNMPEATCGLVISLGSVCDWRGHGSFSEEFAVDANGALISLRAVESPVEEGWVARMMHAVRDQLFSAYSDNVGIVQETKDLDGWLNIIRVVKNRPLKSEEARRWKKCFARFFTDLSRSEKNIDEAGFFIRFVEWVERRLKRRWYIQMYGKNAETASEHLSDRTTDISRDFSRLRIPTTMTPPQTPSLLPFHTFAYPMTARLIRLIAHRHALRTSYSALTSPWLPNHIQPPPSPPVRGKINIGYVSSDFNDHPSSHLMQSVFELHNRELFNVHVYATSPSDGSPYRQKIEHGSQHFVDISSSSLQEAVERILSDNIHILVNLNGYTRSAKNEIFATRPCPVQLQLMGFASTLAAGWCDYLVCDEISCPRDLSATERWRERTKNDQETSRLQDGFVLTHLETDLDADADPDAKSEDWVYTEKLLYMPHTYMVTDHKQEYQDDVNLSANRPVGITPDQFWEKEEMRRTALRKTLFPNISQNTIIFANFNQLYKIDPSVFVVWLRILKRVPNSILWLLRFPTAGEQNIIRAAQQWGGDEIAARICFTAVAKKKDHILRAKVADLFLDTLECSAHTVAADVIWSGTPIITWPKYRYKMASRVCASMLHATGFGEQMVVNSLEEYEDRAVRLARSVTSTEESPFMTGALIDLRRAIYLNRDSMINEPIFDTRRWTRNIEKGYREVWRRWVEGTQFESSDEWEACDGPEKDSGCVWVRDEEPQ